MNYISNSRKNNRKKKGKVLQILIITIAVMLSIILLANINVPILSNIAGKIVYGLDVCFSSIKGIISEGTDYFGNIKKLTEENEMLKEKVEELNINLLEKEKIELENDDLRNSLNIAEKYNHFTKVYANVILRDYTNWNETFVINKGAKDGIKEKQTVISSEGLVGYVSKVTQDTSIVTTILDPNTSVSVEIATINKLALAKGDFDLKTSGFLKLTNIPINAELTVGEKIYTSGIGTMYDKGLVIGQIKEVINNKNDIDRYAIIEPFADFESLDSVAVIID